MYVTNTDSRTAARDLEESLGLLSQWCNKNKLTVNVKKQQYMIVSPIGVDPSMERVIPNGKFLEKVRYYTYLGITIDGGLTFENFLTKKLGKVNTMIHQLGKLRQYNYYH